MSATDSIDYSLYLVTGRDLLPPGKDYLESLEESLQGGVTVVQIREKNTDTGEFLRVAQESKTLCDRYNVPLLINDRIDIALAVNARGVHIGQTDIPLVVARRLLPKDSIIGISCNNVNHVKMAVEDGADYIGIGAVWGTQTKQLTSPLIGVRGVGAMLEILDGTKLKAVAIGGIKSTNLLRTLYGSVSRTGHTLDGVAVVSGIVASPQPRVAAEKLSSILRAFRQGVPRTLTPGDSSTPDSSLTQQSIIDGVLRLMEGVRNRNPLVHQITNTVVATQSANVTLALGASPIMATAPQEMEDLARVCGALLINIGTLRAESHDGMLKAGCYANANRKPIVFDPVGVGASTFRKETVKELLNTWQATVIKGNAGELAALSGSTEVEAKGVDSVGPGFKDPVSFVKNLARKERCIVVLTGATDYISDGQSVVILKNGHEILGKFTGSGCIVGSSVATYCATAAAITTDGRNTEGQLVHGDMLLGAIAGVLVLTVAAELAVRKDSVNGPGTFLSGLIDELWNLAPETVQQLANIEVR